jgi:glycosyltransferase involved in cell wall biosynthesis
MELAKSTRPLTIVHTEASTGWGGQEIRILQEARWFRQRGDRVILLAPRESQILERFSSDGFQVRVCPFRKGQQWLDTFRLAGEFRKIRPNVIGTHSSVDSWSGLLGARLARVPVKLRYRHVSAAVRPHLLNRLLYATFSDHVLTTAEIIKRQLIDKLGVDPAKVTTVATGIDAPAFGTTREEDRLALCRELQLPESSRFFGCVAVLRSWKGQDDLIRAFDLIHATFPDYRLILVGDGPYRGPLEKLRASLPSGPRIHFLGHKDSPWPCFRSFDAAVLPSYKDEGIPQSLLQAMFAETPVIGTSAGGIPEIVSHERTGLIVPPRSVERLADALATVASHRGQAEARAMNALGFVRGRHTLDHMGNAVLEIVQRVARNRIASS